MLKMPLDDGESDDGESGTFSEFF